MIVYVAVMERERVRVCLQMATGYCPACGEMAYCHKYDQTLREGVETGQKRQEQNHLTE